MVSKNIKNIAEKGSLMIEALAMLGLISMVTPIIYKKAAERNSEIQDVNSAAQIRNIVKAVDDYTKNNYLKITQGEEVESHCSWRSNPLIVDFDEMSNAGEVSKEIPIENLCEYLPYGFLDENGEVGDDRIFGKNYKVYLKKTDGGSDKKKALTNFVVASPKQGSDFHKIRSSRIASMIGSNGGYIDEKGKARGVQGMWYIDDPKAAFGFDIKDQAGENKDVTKGAIISSSVQPISTGGGAEHLLHRNFSTNRELNRMRTTILMDKNDIDEIGQAIIEGNGRVNKDQALLLKDGTGAYITGIIQAAKQSGSDDMGFKIDAAANLTTLGSITAANEAFVVDEDTITFKNTSNDVLTVGSDGEMKLTGNAEITKGLTVGEKATIGDGYVDGTVQLDVDGSAHVQGDLKVDKKLSVDEIDTRFLRAGSDNLHATDPNEYTLIVDKNTLKVQKSSGGEELFTIDRRNNEINVYDGNLIVRKGGSADANKIFEVDKDSAYTIVKGLQAGTKDRKALQVFNANETVLSESFLENDIAMRLNGTGNKIVAYDSRDKVALGIYDDESLLQVTKKNTNNKAQVSATIDYNSNPVAFLLTGEDEPYRKNSKIGVRKNSITLDVNNDVSVRDDEPNKSNIALYAKGNSARGALANNELWLQESTDLRVVKGTNLADEDNIFHVETTKRFSPSEKYVAGDLGMGSVNVRRGTIDLAYAEHSDRAGYNTVNPYSTASIAANNDIGHIKADMLLSNESFKIANTRPSKFDFTRTGEYDTFMVNPAYTSVMHDIKLTTRGGARLSDVLPDFINKGIYVADNTYEEDGTITETQLKNNENLIPAGARGGPASPYVGTVPAPLCPPGYRYAVTVTPFNFAMAQTFTPMSPEIRKDGNETRGRGSQYSDGGYYDYPTDAFSSIQPGAFVEGDDEYITGRLSATALYFQKSTWLRSKAYPIKADSVDFSGWNILVGFIYPKGAFGQNNKYFDKFKGFSINTQEGPNFTAYWNLYPSFEGELEAIVTTYCFFERKRWTNEYVDSTYDQLDSTNRRKIQTKGDNAYTKRLNDPNLKYKDVW